MCQESRATKIIEQFEQDTRPIFVVYGADLHFTDVIESFRQHFQKRPEDLYFFLDMGVNKRDTPGETFFEIVRQIVDLLLDKFPDPDEQTRLFQPFRMLTNLKEKTRSYEPDEQLAEFVRFTYYSCYPTLGEVFSKRKQLIVIEFKRFETVVEWGRKIHNYILDSLLKTSEGANLRFVLFVQSNKKPRLFYGSDEEGSRDKVTFYKIERESEHQDSPLIPSQYIE